MPTEPELDQSQSTSLMPLNGDTGRRMSTNFDGQGMGRMAFISKVTQEKCINADESLNQQIAMRYWFVHEIELMNEKSGELRTVVRTVIVDDHGTAYQFVSDGVYSSLRTFVSIMGPGPYEPPLMVMPKQGNSKGGRRYFYLQPMGEGKPA